VRPSTVESPHNVISREIGSNPRTTHAVRDTHPGDFTEGVRAVAIRVPLSFANGAVFFFFVGGPTIPGRRPADDCSSL